jgi:long-chain acyl-CoA synthetase
VTDLRDLLRAKAAELGFDVCRFASASKPWSAGERLRHFVEAGRHGEMGWMERGELHLAGRAGRMVTVADQNVFPEEIEAFLAGLPGVRRAVVLPRPDRMRGHVIVAVLEGDPAQEAAILRATRARLGPLKMPRAVIWRETWPETASGKVDLTRLAAEVGL